jgi:hypothetical protein
MRSYERRSSRSITRLPSRLTEWMMASHLAGNVRQSPCPLHPREAQPLDQALPRLASPRRGNIVWAPNLAPMLAEGRTVR